jgi:hypothetical protein
MINPWHKGEVFTYSMNYHYLKNAKECIYKLIMHNFTFLFYCDLFNFLFQCMVTYLPTSFNVTFLTSSFNVTYLQAFSIQCDLII